MTATDNIFCKLLLNIYTFNHFIGRFPFSFAELESCIAARRAADCGFSAGDNCGFSNYSVGSTGYGGDGGSNTSYAYSLLNSGISQQTLVGINQGYIGQGFITGSQKLYLFLKQISDMNPKEEFFITLFNFGYDVLHFGVANAVCYGVQNFKNLDIYFTRSLVIIQHTNVGNNSKSNRKAYLTSKKKKLVWWDHGVSTKI